ncbi:hypothetical protein RJ55_03233 [Drechmeria coniospora]|nr:hypothetical protein RJ55_03233 [Drechmeria coniospora]
MSGLVNKVKEALLHDKTDSTHATGQTKNSAEPRTGFLGHGTTGHDGPYATGDHYVTGGDNSNRGADGPATRTDGPHSSNMANKVDPRVDSDGDRSQNLGANPHGTATTGNTTTPATRGLSATTGHTTTTGHHSSNLDESRALGSNTATGPHSSKLVNKVDPRVDSDLDGSRTLGANTTAAHSTTAGHNATGMVSGAAGHAVMEDANRGFDGPASKTDGPHSSNMANKLDPRVDSDRDHSKNLGANPSGSATTDTTTDTTKKPASGTGGQHAFFTGAIPPGTGLIGTTGTHNQGAPEGTYGHHNSRLANVADPRIDSDAGGSHDMGSNTHSTMAGVAGTHGSTGTHTGPTGTRHDAPGPAPNTAGPHKSDMMNKLDPRVDSDLDGSKTIGGDKTDHLLANKDPTDAAQVPPSVLRKHVGDVQIQHDDAEHEREERHSISHQEQHRGL